jgi:hypothetical protein
LSIAATAVYIETLLKTVTWPASMLALPSPPGPLQVFITPPNPQVVAAAPTACVWLMKWLESRDNAKYGAGTVPRALVAGGASGTKAVEYQVPVYIAWEGAGTDPNADILFPGMLDAICSVLRVSADPVLITDPWTAVQSWLVDVGERITGDTDLWALENQRLNRWDCLLTVSVVEVIAG